MERRLEKKTIIDKVTFFDKETKRDGFYLSILQNNNINITDFPETSQDEKIGQGQMNSMNSIVSFLFFRSRFNEEKSVDYSWNLIHSSHHCSQLVLFQ